MGIDDIKGQAKEGAGKAAGDKVKDALNRN